MLRRRERRSGPIPASHRIGLQKNFVELALKGPQARKIRVWGLRQSKIVIRIRLARLPGLGGFRYFDKVA